MKILYLAHRIPYPPNKGDKIRSFHQIKHLSRNHQIYLACLTDKASDLIYERDLKNFCEEVCIVPFNKFAAKTRTAFSLFSFGPLTVSYFYSKHLQRKVDQWLLLKFDAIICFSSPMAEYVFRSPMFKCCFVWDKKKEETLKQKNFKWSTISSKSIGTTHYYDSMKKLPRLIMDFCDVDSDKWRQYALKTTLPMNLIYKVESKRLLNYEKKINSVFDYSVFISKQEANLFSKLFPEHKHVYVMRNGVDYAYFCPDVVDPFISDVSTCTFTLLFTGAMDYYANVDGVTWFCHEILPLIKKEFPNVQFYIVGSNPSLSVKKLGKQKDVTVTGFVDDVRPYYMISDVFVAPLRLARGIQNKILEAMAMRKPVVTTTKALEGIEACSGEHLLVSDNCEDFAKSVIALLKDSGLRRNIGNVAREFVMKNFDWSTNMELFQTLLTK